ncbi:MAG: sugar phosphate nucleotidyltransferase [Bacillota bacterium]
MKAVIMAGGSGTRLRPLTCDLPKPMVPILNIPVMEHIINHLKRSGIEDIAVTTYYLPQKIKNYFANGEKWGVNLHYFQEDEPLGTAGSVQNAAEFLDQSFIVISGDAISDYNLNKAINFHKEMKAEATLLLAKVKVPLDYGIVIIDEKNKIKAFVEKPNWSQVFSDTVNTGIYILEPKVFDYYKKGIKYDFSKDLFPLMLKAGKALYGLPLEGYWNDIGSISDYYKTNKDFLLGKINLDINQGREVAKGIFLEDGVKIANSAKIKAPTYIGKNTKIAKGVKINSSIIGSNSVIKENTSIKNSLFWSNNIISKNAEIRSSLIAKGVKVEEGVRIYDQSIIGEFVKIAKNTTIHSGVKIWPNKIIGENSELRQSIKKERRWKDTLFYNDHIKGEKDFEINPEFIMRLAYSISSSLGEEGEIALATDGSEITESYKYILAGTLMECGNEVIDLGEIIKNAFKFNIEKLSLSLGVYLSNNEEEINIHIFDKNGITISENTKKEIEKKYISEKFNLKNKKSGNYSYLPQKYKEYLRALKANINFEKIKEKYFKITINNEGEIFPFFKFLQKLNCQIINGNFSNHESKLAFDNSDIYVKFNNDFTQLKILNNRKEEISQYLLNYLLAKILIDKGLKMLYLPLNFPRAIEEYAQKKDVQIRYCRTNKRDAVFNSYKYFKKKNKLKKGFLYPFSDPLFALVLILEKMAVENNSLAEIIDKLPDIYYQKAEIACNKKRKAEVMRILAKEAKDKKKLIDGLRFEHDDGWALIFPDGEKEIFHVFVEGVDMETAESLSGFYLEKIKKILKSNFFRQKGK